MYAGLLIIRTSNLRAPATPIFHDIPSIETFYEREPSHCQVQSVS